MKAFYYAKLNQSNSGSISIAIATTNDNQIAKAQQHKSVRHHIKNQPQNSGLQSATKQCTNSKRHSTKTALKVTSKLQAKNNNQLWVAISPKTVKLWVPISPKTVYRWQAT